MKKTIKILVSFVMIFSLVLSGLSGNILKVNAAPNDTKSLLTSDSIVADLIGQKYSEVLKSWKSVPVVSRANFVALPDLNTLKPEDMYSKENSRGYKSSTIRFHDGNEVTYTVNVDKAGLYQLAFDYFSLGTSILSAETNVKINGEFQYFESRRIVFEDLWKSNNNKIKLDRYKNEIVPKPTKSKRWLKTYAYDASHFYAEPLLFNLKSGMNKITLKNTVGEMLLGDVSVVSPVVIDSYKKYIGKKKQEMERKSNKVITIEAEKFSYKNDASIRPDSESDNNLTPLDSERKLLNVISEDSWKKGNQEVTWNFSVPKSGFYHLSFKYLQDLKVGLPVYRTIKIDGEVPFKELNNYPFRYGKDWRNETLGKKGAPYWIYLGEGKHTLSLGVNLSKMRPVSDEISKVMKEISELTLEIQKLTGNKKDIFRDWDIADYIPGIKQRMDGWAKRLENQYKGFAKQGDVEELINLKLAVSQLNRLSKDPNELPNKLDLLSQGSSSVSQLLGDLQERIIESPLSLDKIYIYQKNDLPDPTAGFFESVWADTKKFFLSFTKTDYAVESKDTKELEVWVNRPRQNIQIMQQMIDEEFTPKTGIRVNLSIMPDENKLILANASNTEPDVALGVSNWLPYEMAVRGAVLDLRRFDDVNEVMKSFSKGALIPLTFEKGIYAIPETQNFWVTFYRQDILSSLKIPVPDTWEDVVNILPELQRLGMNYYEPNAGSGGFKSYITTAPFIYQYGGELFKDGGMATAIDSEKALKGIKMMTDLYTIYNLPQSVPNFYNHFRSGLLPVGISDFNTYIQLKTAAPEIANLWKIAPHPGVKGADGEVARWAPAGGTTGVIFKGTKKADEGWAFLKWWMSKNVQVSFANTLQTTFGDTYMWNTANIDAFEDLPWSDEDKKVILEQYKWVRDASRVPGGYMLEREISNIWNKVVFEGTNLRTTVDDSVILTDREILRKMEEFGYVKNGKVIKPYPVPTIDTIRNWGVGR